MKLHYLACGDTKSKPSFLSDKSLESSIKSVVRKFPNVDLKPLSNIHPIRGEIVKSLSLYYYTFVDLLDFKVGAAVRKIFSKIST